MSRLTAWLVYRRKKTSIRLLGRRLTRGDLLIKPSPRRPYDPSASLMMTDKSGGSCQDHDQTGAKSEGAFRNKRGAAFEELLDRGISTRSSKMRESS